MKDFRMMFALTVGCTVFACAGGPQRAAAPTERAEQAGIEPIEQGVDAEDEPSDKERSPFQGSSSFDLSSLLGGGGKPVASEGDDAPTIAEVDEPGAGACRESSAALAISVSRESADLKKGSLMAQMDGPICNLSLRIERTGGLPAVTKRFRYAGPERRLQWTPIPRDEIAKIEVSVESQNGATERAFLIPWSVSIDHDEVVFDTNQAVIRPSELSSLEDSLEKIKAVLAEGEDYGLTGITLYIAGHTDTRGSAQHNMVLSQNRARSIANWFMQAGLCTPIAFQGFGESALRRVTADEVDEQENRRVDYILSVEPPLIREGAPAAWQWMSRGC